METTENTRGWGLAGRALGTLLLVDCLLLLPEWIRGGGPGPRWLSLEAALLVSLFLLLPRRRWSGALAGVAGVLILGVVGLLLADTTARMSLARPLNLYLDARLLSSVHNLLEGTLGAGLGTLALGGGLLVAIGLAAGIARFLAGLRLTPGAPRRAAIPGAVLLLLFAALIPGRWMHPRGVAFALPVTELTVEQNRQMRRMLGERDRFESEMRAATDRWASTPGLLERLEGRDVTLAFVESYGISSLEDPRYGPVVGPAVEALEESVEARGMSIATGLLRSPSQGGMSWLGHATVLSGLWLENQLRYDLLLASDRHTLIDDFEAAGYRSAALMPQITLAWPEGTRLGYEQIVARKDIDYRGPPLNWVEMPDQFTWSVLEEEIRPGDDRPLFAEIGLISSHAPWTPILDLEPWDSIGSGERFERWRDAGPAPDELWADHDDVRAYFARSVHYAVRVAASYVDARMPERSVLLLLGDHQPAPMITGDDASRAVPIHVISDDPGIVRAFEELGFVPGARPPTGVAEIEIPRMNVLRDWFVRRFSTTTEDRRATQ